MAAPIKPIPCGGIPNRRHFDVDSGWLVGEKTAALVVQPQFTATTIFRVVSHLLVPSSCRLQLTLFASLAHDATTRRTRLDIGEGDGVVVTLTQPNLTQTNPKQHSLSQPSLNPA